MNHIQLIVDDAALHFLMPIHGMAANININQTDPIYRLQK